MTLFEAAKKYLEAHIDGKILDIKSWKKEADKLVADKKKYNRDFTRLKEDVRQIGIAKTSIEHILDRASAVKENPIKKSRGMEL